MGETATIEQAGNAAQPTIPENSGNALPPLSETPVSSLDSIFDEPTPAPVVPPSEATPGTPEPESPKPEETPVAAEPAVEEVPKPEEATPEPETAPKVLPNRISTQQFSEVEQEAIALGKALKDAGEEVPSLKDRIEIVENRRKAEAQAEAAAVVPAKAPEPSAVDTLTAELADLDAKLNEAGEKESAFTPELAETVRKRSDVAAKLELAKERQLNAEAAAQKGFDTQRAEAKAEAARLFPSSTDRNSELNKRVNAEIAALKDPAHADHDSLYAAKSPLLITQKVAMDLARENAEANGTSLAVELAALMPGAPAKAKAPVATPTLEPAKPAAPQTKKVAPAAVAAPPTPPPAPDPAALLRKPFDPKAYDDEFESVWGKSKFMLGR